MKETERAARAAPETAARAAPEHAARAAPEHAARAALADVARAEAGLVVASLVASFGDLGLAEDAFQDAVAAALERWPAEGVPERPAAWLTVTARRRAVDRLRHGAMRGAKEELLRTSERLRRAEREAEEVAEDVRDERLSLLFTCCHPALAPEARVALTLRTLGGLSTEAVARAFLLPVSTLAKRLERAKAKIRAARIPYRVPPEAEWPERLGSVLAVLYLVFNEGHGAGAAEPAERRALCEEAIRLARVLTQLAPTEGEVHALFALMRLVHARRDTRQGAEGAFVPLDAQDRTRWRRDEIGEGVAALRIAAGCGRRGPFQVEAAIAAAHALAPSGAETPWPRIASLYAELEALTRSPVVRVNRAIAVSRAENAEAGLALLAALDADAERRLADYAPYHAARADLLRRAGQRAAAAAAYRAALALTTSPPDHAFLTQHLAALERDLP